MAKAKKKQAPQMRTMPHIVSYEAYFKPPPAVPVCSAEVTTESTIAWRDGNERQIRKAIALGVPLTNCFMRATHMIGDRWYCTKHAGMIALQLLQEEAP
jgi:hypothetical protein